MNDPDLITLRLRDLDQDTLRAVPDGTDETCTLAELRAANPDDEDLEEVLTEIQAGDRLAALIGGGGAPLVLVERLLGRPWTTAEIHCNGCDHREVRRLPTDRLWITTADGWPAVPASGPWVCPACGKGASYQTLPVPSAQEVTL